MNQSSWRQIVCIIIGMSVGNSAPAFRKDMLMLEYFVVSTWKQRRLSNGPFTEVLEPLAEWLHQQGYCHATGADWFWRIIHFHRWFKARGFRNRALKREHVDQYLNEQPVRRRKDGRSLHYSGQRSVFRVALTLLEERRMDRTGMPITKAPSFLDGFEAHLRAHCSLSLSCIRFYLRWIRRLHQFALGSPDAKWRTLKPSTLLDFVQTFVQERKPTTCRGMIAALRSYFRYLQLCNCHVSPLLDALPRIRHFSRPLPERILTVEQQRLWLNGIDRSTAEGRRDFAMALCLCDLGIRVGDLALLTLDDLDWRKGAIRIPNGKRKRPFWLPLPDRVGKAIAAYVKRDRPKTDRREVFLRHRPPCAVPLAATNIQSRLQKVAREQGLPQPLTGTHALRHTAATRMYERGTSLKEVADVLGHESLKSTTIYAKISCRELAQVALPWPEVHP